MYSDGKNDKLLFNDFMIDYKKWRDETKKLLINTMEV